VACVVGIITAELIEGLYGLPARVTKAALPRTGV
jgi:hypothetical protein